MSQRTARMTKKYFLKRMSTMQATLIYIVDLFPVRQCRNAGRETTGSILSEPAGKGSATGTPVGMCPARRHSSFDSGLTGEFPLLSALSSSPAPCKSGQSKTYPRHRLFPVPILSSPIFFRIFAQNVETRYDDRRSAAAHAATHTAT